MSLKTIEQERAEFSYGKIIAVTEKNEELQKKYKSLVRGFGPMVLLNGLGQALAFLKAKGKKDLNEVHNLFYTHLNEWLKKKFAPGKSDFDILDRIREEDSSTYRFYTQATLALLTWHKKFAEAELKDEE